MYDPELPAGFQDADFEMREMEDAARSMQRAGKVHGICFHNSSVGLGADGVAHYPEAEGLKPGERRCTDLCGKVMTGEAMDEDRDYQRHMWT